MGETAPPDALRRLGFLVGRFRGEGVLSGGRVRVEKEAEGAWEAGGHFLALRMTASYRVGERLADRHEALVLVGTGDDAVDFLATAHTDSGSRLDYDIVLDGDALVFEDRPPHGSKAVRARKTITPTGAGYRERLDLESASGETEMHLTLDMRRIGAAHDTPGVS